MRFQDLSLLVDQRARFVTDAEFSDWKSDRLKSHIIACCGYDYRTRIQKTEPRAHSLAALDVVLISDLYKENQEFIQYSLAHEKYEIWQLIAFNAKPSDAHCLARCHQYSLAVQAGDGERLLQFHESHAKQEHVDLEITHFSALDFALRHFSKSALDLTLKHEAK